MKSFREYLNQQDASVGLREHIVQMINRLSHLQPKDVAASKDLLLDLQKMVDQLLTGGE